MSLCDSFSMKSPSKNPEILVKEELFTSLTVELETGRFEKIEILYNDDPMKLAEEFLIQHKIDLKIKDLLAKNIQDAKEKASKEKAKKNTSKSLIEPYPSIYYENLPYFEEDWYYKKEPKIEEKAQISSNGINKEFKGPQNLLLKIKKILNPSLNKHAELNPIDKDLTFTPTLNQKSLEIIRKSPDFNIPAYQRLFHNKKEKPNENKEENKSHEEKPEFSSSNKKPKKNQQFHPFSERKNSPEFGDRLYYNALCSIEKRKNNIEKRQYQKICEEIKDLTFHPEINAISQMIGRTNVGKNQKLEDYFIELYKLKNERIEQAIIEKKDEEIKECSFHPQINLLSHFLTQERKKINKSNSLHDKKRKKQNHYSHNENLTFKPQIALKSTNFMKKSEDFLTRLEKDQFLRAEKTQEKEKLIAQNIDPITGEKYFEPNITLFRTPMKRPESSMEIRKPRELSPEIYPAFKPNEQSNRLFEARKLTKLKRIFEVLDGDGDGLISGDRMEIDKLPDMAYEILKPVLLDITEEEKEVDFEGFIKECGKLMKKLTITEKADIFGSNKKAS